MNNFTFSKLCASLNFQNDFSQFSILIEGHLQNVQTLLLEFIQGSLSIPQQVREGLATLPPEGVLRLVTSPYLCELLMLLKESVNPDTQVKIEDQIINAFVAEIRHINPNFNYELKPQWTINSDIVLDQKIATQFPALQTKCGLNLNYQSFVHNTGHPGIGGYDFNLALKHKERIETGRDIVAAVSKSAHSIIENFTTMIQFRNNTERANVVNSSTHTSIGLIRCDNFHKIHSDLPEIVDMLVHESIHQYLHLYEEQISPFVDEEKMTPELKTERLFPSPWSGNPLDLRSYTHAVLVWYGLVHFWQQFIDSGYSHVEISQAQAQDKLSEALFGFVNSNSVLDNLGVNVQLLNTDYIADIRRLQAEIKAKKAV